MQLMKPLFLFASENASLLKIVVGKKVPKVEVGGLKVVAEKPQISSAGVLLYGDKSLTPSFALFAISFGYANRRRQPIDVYARNCEIFA